MDKEQVKKILRGGDKEQITIALKEYFKLNHIGYVTAVNPGKQALLDSFNAPLTVGS